MQIGQSYIGGIVFYIDGTGNHGLVAAPSDQSASTSWYNGTYKTTNATGSIVGTGLANTNLITASLGVGTYAATICTSLNISGTGWYLPSKDELSLMYANIGPGASGSNANIGGFVSGSIYPYIPYWTSTEYPGYFAWAQWFGKGNHGCPPAFKDKSRVRAIKAF